MVRRARHQSFDDAMSRHHMVGDAITILGRDGARSVWAALTGRGKILDEELHLAASVTIHEDHAVLLRRAGGVPAAFALKAIAARVRNIQGPRDDIVMREAINLAWEDFQERIDLANDVQEGFGCDLSDSWLTVREVIGDRYRATMMREIALLAGRMHKTMVGVKVPMPDANPEEVQDVENGGNLALLLASERAMMAHPVLGGIATMRVLKHEAQQLKLAGEHEGCRGPLVLCIDSSGSMHDEWSGKLMNEWWSGQDRYGSGRNTWAKACAVALTRIAHDDGRQVVAVHFGTATHRQDLAPGDHRAVAEMAGTFLSGGTATARALDISVDEVKDLGKRGFEGADVVVITDGEDSARERIAESVEQLKRANTRLWTVAIECGFDGANPLRAEAEKYVHVHGANLNAEAAKGLEDAAFDDVKRKRR